MNTKNTASKVFGLQDNHIGLHVTLSPLEKKHGM